MSGKNDHGFVECQSVLISCYAYMHTLIKNGEQTIIIVLNYLTSISKIVYVNNVKKMKHKKKI